MKTMNQQIKEAAYIVLAIGVLAVVASDLSGCGVNFQGKQGAAGSTGATGATGPQGAQGYGAGVAVTQLAAGNPNCPTGGVQIVNFQDLGNTGIEQPSDPILGLSYVCNGAVGATGSTGATGATGATGSTGATGATGAAGTNGSNGTNGTSTTFSIVPDSGTNCSNGGFDLTLTDASHSQTEYVCNGANGNNGQAGLNGTNGTNGGTVTFNLVQAIEPCGAASSPWKEVLLGLQGGQILSDFSETTSGQDTRLSFIPNGTYQDTDESGCTFTVSGDGLTWSEISWGAGSNQYSSWPADDFYWTASAGWIEQ